MFDTRQGLAPHVADSSCVGNDVDQEGAAVTSSRSLPFGDCVSGDDLVRTLLLEVNRLMAHFQAKRLHEWWRLRRLLRLWESKAVALRIRKAS